MLHCLPLQQAIDKAKSMGVTFLVMKWTDSESFVIPQADLCACVEFIHDALTSGSSVLVHCAQVSRGVASSACPLPVTTNHWQTHPLVLQ